MKLSQNFKIPFVPEMSKEFSKGAFNGSQNLKNSLGEESLRIRKSDLTSAKANAISQPRVPKKAA